MEFNPETGFHEYLSESEFQSAPTKVEILPPDHLDANRTYPVVYILPVDGRSEYGHGLVEARKADLANKHGVICVYPAFARVPWFGNHATDPRIRQIDYMTQSLVPRIDSEYPTQRDKEGRWLIGFSKSGWGAFTLLLEHMDLFGYAAAWDAPLMMNGDNTGAEWGPMGIESVFGTKENFQRGVPTRLVNENAAALRQQCRLVLGGGPGCDWSPHDQQFHELLEELNVPHVYRADLNLRHRWDTNWLPPLMEELAGIARAPASDAAHA